LIPGTDTDLVVACLVVEGCEEQRPSRIAEIVDSVVTARDGAFEREGDLVQTAVRDTETPDKVFNGSDVFLMRLGGEDDGRTPRSEAFPHPAIGFQNLELGHDNFAFMRSAVRLLAADRR
jgi:hypothetical protein